MGHIVWICSSVHPSSNQFMRYLSSWNHLSRIVLHWPFFLVLAFLSISRALWYSTWRTCLTVGLLPLIIILTAASLSSKHVQHSGKLRKCYIRKHIVNVKLTRTVVLGWNVGLVSGVLAWCGMTQQVPPMQIDVWFYCIDVGNNGTLL